MADDPTTPFHDMFRKFGERLNIPGPDLAGMMDMHRKNLRALQAATEIGTASMQDLMGKQRAALEETLGDIAEAVQQVAQSDAGAQMMATPMELAKKSFDTTLRNTTEMAEIVQKGNTEAYSVLRDRVLESIDEMAKPSK